MRIRATTITDWDHKELIVPNKEFITSRVNDRIGLVVFAGAAYTPVFCDFVFMVRNTGSAMVIASPRMVEMVTGDRHGSTRTAAATPGRFGVSARP